MAVDPRPERPGFDKIIYGHNNNKNQIGVYNNNTVPIIIRWKPRNKHKRIASPLSTTFMTLIYIPSSETSSLNGNRQTNWISMLSTLSKKYPRSLRAKIMIKSSSNDLTVVWLKIFPLEKILYLWKILLCLRKGSPPNPTMFSWTLNSGSMKMIMKSKRSLKASKFLIRFQTQFPSNLIFKLWRMSSSCKKSSIKIKERS